MEQFFARLCMRLCGNSHHSENPTGPSSLDSSFGQQPMGPSPPLLEAVSDNPTEPSLPLLEAVSEYPTGPSPLASSFGEKILPLLDAVDGLRNLDIMKEGIPLPNIVVIGDQSSGKSSVLESLARIKIPNGQGMCTRLPLVLQLKGGQSPDAEIQLKYGDTTLQLSEDQIAQEIVKATERILKEEGKVISETPITLAVKKKGMPDLTLIDLPGIIRVFTEGQPEDIGKQIKNLIKNYIGQEDSIILNVLPATADFTTCGSIKMSRKVDRDGKRTLAVVTKVDIKPQGLPDMVNKDDVKIGRGYVCVRNRVGEESYEAAREIEQKLFTADPLSQIDKSKVGVGIPMLADKLVKIQEEQIRKCLPRIAFEIDDKLGINRFELSKLPQIQEKHVKDAFDLQMDKVIESLKKILVRGEFEEFPNDNDLHCTARILKKVNEFYQTLKTEYPIDDGSYKGLPSTQAKSFMEETQELHQLKETQGLWLPCLLDRNAFIVELQRRVNGIAEKPVQFMMDVWKYVEVVVHKLLVLEFHSYSQMQPVLTKAASNVLNSMRDSSVKRMREMVEMEKNTDYTCNPDYTETMKELMKEHANFIELVLEKTGEGSSHTGGLGKDDDADNLRKAFDLMMKKMAYWKIVIMRMVDVSAMHLKLSIKNLVDRKLKHGIKEEVLGMGEKALQKMMEEPIDTARRRKELKERINKLEKARRKVAPFMKDIAA